MDPIKNKFLLQAARSLGACQSVEVQLNHYITQALELVRKCLAGQMVFKMSGQDYQDSSLERLIEVFRKLSDCPELVKKLEAFKKERNFVAHKAIASSLDYEGEIDLASANDIEVRFKKVEQDASDLTLAIHEESLKFVGYLYFNNLDKE